MGVPLYSNNLNLIRGTKVPDDVCYTSEAYFYSWNSLYERLCSRFNFTVPDHWEKDMFEFNLFADGFVGVFDTNKYARTPNQKYGIIPAKATLTGVGVQYQPTRIMTANPYFYMPAPEGIYIGAGLIKLTHNYTGVLHIVDFYADKLAVLLSTVDQSLMNSRFAYIVGASSPAAAATLKAVFDQRNSGKPLIVYDNEKIGKVSDKSQKVSAANLAKENPFNVVDLEVGKNYITDKLMADYRRLLAAFDEEIGIPNNPIDKAERLISNEVESNSADTVARSTKMLERLQLSIKKTIEVFPDLEGKLSVEFTEYDTGATGAREAGKEVDYNA